MICKWCGARTVAGEVKCRNCGRDNPPLSDCGGFYDLTAPFRPATAPVRQETRVDLTGVQQDMKRYAIQSRKGHSGLLVTVLIGLVIVTALLIVLLTQVAGLRAQVAELADAVSSVVDDEEDLPEKTEPSDHTEPEEETEPSEETEPAEAVDPTEEVESSEEDSTRQSPEENTEAGEV